MGRELKRVPLDFQYPLNKVWEGYLNPHYKPCPDCEHGYTNARRRLQDLVHLIMIAGEDSRRGENHPWSNQASLFFHGTPSPDMAELTSGLAGREPSFLGHDACDKWSAEKKIIAAAGLDPQSWGVCQTCQGDAIAPNARNAYETWEQTEPPTGEGYQLWETTSEGSPISPIFASLTELCDWCADNATTFGSNKTTAKEWRRMLDDGFVCHQEGNCIFT